MTTISRAPARIGERSRRDDGQSAPSTGREAQRFGGFSREPPGPRPFLKWAGGKRRLLSQLEPLMPQGFRRYFEPFVGGGAMFFALGPGDAVLGDVNGELADCYRAIRDDVGAVVAALGAHRYEKRHYYSVRALDPRSLALPDRAARTIFLNRTCFNGLYRVNREGRFNVSFGRYDAPVICDEDNLRACAEVLAEAAIQVGDFEGTLEAAGEGDFVYLDPPYVPASEAASFTAYSAAGFGLADHARLARVFRRLAKRGAKVMLSNSDAPAVRALYAGFPLDRVEAPRCINSDGSGRGRVGELVVRSYG